ncbi:MAG: HlyD family secretion protein [Bacteroidetes bacterium]|nr:HlyD family secretion protein [Bacteroidota bacterium]MBS1930987.1 HlyD family secretion protein [Bacteroidota bacterium]
METRTNEVQQPRKKRNPVFMIILVALIIGGAWFGFSKYRHSLHHEETDDAQVSADILPVIPHVSGYIKLVRVNDNQLVKKGDTLLILDNRDYTMKLEEAEAALEIAKANLQNARAMSNASKANIATTAASVITIDSQIAAAKITVWRADQDYQRYANLIKDHSITQQQYEQAWAAKETAQKQLSILQSQKNQASQQTNAVTVQSNATTGQINVAEAAIRQREVDVDAAKLNLSYTVITAEEDGHISKVNVQPGQFVQAGQALFAVVHSQNVWVVANFKETQLNKMREGQAVVIKADAFPNHKFQATVGSFSPATGSTFALLPPDNATGNFVKVVQRLPVKIEFTDPSDTLVRKLRAGLNVTVDVHLD